LHEILPLLTGGAGALGIAGVWIGLFLSGRLHSDREFRGLETERDYWRTACTSKDESLQLERRAANDAARAGTVTNQILQAFTAVVTERTETRAVPPALTGKDGTTP
jgi:hypothetical protein